MSFFMPESHYIVFHSRILSDVSSVELEVTMF